MSCFAGFLLNGNCRYFDNPFQRVICNNSLKDNLILLALTALVAALEITSKVQILNQHWFLTTHTIGKLGPEHFWQTSDIEAWKKRKFNTHCDVWPRLNWFFCKIKWDWKSFNSGLQDLDPGEINFELVLNWTPVFRVCLSATPA